MNTGYVGCMNTSEERMHDSRFDAMLRMVGDYGDVMTALAEMLNVWGTIDRESFIEAFTEQIRDLSDLIPENLIQEVRP